MALRKFGRTGWEVSEVGYGMWGMGAWSGSEDAESLGSLQRAINLGCNFFDTAWVYGDGHSEKLLGKILQANPRTRIRVATKVPPKTMAWPAPADSALDENYPPQHITEFVDKSLQNLGLETMDLIQLHSCSLAELQKGDVVEALEQARAAGQTRYIGYSGDGQAARYAVECGAFDTLQTSVSVADQEAIELTVPLAQRYRMGVIAKRPIANVAWRYTRRPD